MALPVSVLVRRIFAALAAGGIAIAVNTAMLAGMEALGLRTAHGGLLRLLQDLLPVPAVSAWWLQAGLPAASTGLFQFGFHILVGLGMAVAYAVVLEPFLPGWPWAKGLAYAVALWLLNAFAVLPSIGEGVAGSRSLSAAGIVGFAVAHTVFFVLMAVLYARFLPKD